MRISISGKRIWRNGYFATVVQRNSIIDSVVVGTISQNEWDDLTFTTQLTRFRSCTRLILAALDININRSDELTLPGDVSGLFVDPNDRSPSDWEVVLCERVRIHRHQQRPGSRWWEAIYWGCGRRLMRWLLRCKPKVHCLSRTNLSSFLSYFNLLRLMLLWVP